MDLRELQEQAKNIAFSTGLLEAWIEKEPPEVKQHLKTVTDGVSYWRDQYFEVFQMLQDANSRYTSLVAEHSNLMLQMAEQKGQLDEMLIEQQREFHKERTS